MTIRENLLVLIEAVQNEPENLLDLSTFGKVVSCGTLHCALGLAATLPHFYMQGIELLQPPTPGKWGSATLSVGGIGIYGSAATIKLNELFGSNSYARLFEPAGDGDWDEELWEVSDKGLALARLNRQLEMYP